MNRDFKSKFGEMQDNQSKAFNQEENNELYNVVGNNRNICFTWPDGRLLSFSYAYLINSTYVPEESYIQLEFTTHKVVLKGYNLQPLYFQIFDQFVRIIRCIDERYVDVIKGEGLVKDIIVTNHGS